MTEPIALTKELVPSVKITRKETKCTEGTGDTKKTWFEPTYEYELFYPFKSTDNIPKVLESLNQYLVDARRDADQREKQKEESK